MYTYMYMHTHKTQTYDFNKHLFSSYSMSGICLCTSHIWIILIL